MDIRRLSDSFAVSRQIRPEDLGPLAEAGFRTVMCNRPDGEDPDQPDFARIESAARAEGLEVCWIPITTGVTPEALEAFSAALQSQTGPMLAYCRSGTRCAMMWAVAQHGRLTDDEILSATRAAGYDMAGILRQMQQIRG